MRDVTTFTLGLETIEPMPETVTISVYDEDVHFQGEARLPPDKAYELGTALIKAALDAGYTVP